MALATVVFALTLLASPLVGAGNFGSVSCDEKLTSKCVARRGNPHPIYLYPSLSNRQENQTIDAIEDYDAKVDASINLYVVTDRLDGYVGVSAGDFGDNGAWAWTACEIAAQYGSNGAGDWCIQQLFRYNEYYLAQYDTPAGTQAIACHELGHTLGLRHATSNNHPKPNETCMRNPPKFNGVWLQSIKGHDRNRLQENYPQ